MHRDEIPMVLYFKIHRDVGLFCVYLFPSGLWVVDRSRFDCVSLSCTCLVYLGVQKVAQGVQL